MRILVAFGTRPEAIKMAPICLQLEKQNLLYKICVTAQHREMLDQVLNFFQLTPDFDLDLMKHNQSLNLLGARILKGMDEIFSYENFDLVLVHGDTTSSILVALAAFNRGIKVAHVEAGLRTYDKWSPFPEELNRQMLTRIADFHFAPTVNAKNNLISENISKSIIVTGNTVVDAIKIGVEKINNGFTNASIENMQDQINFQKKIILVTGHRRESFGSGFENVCEAILEISKIQEVEIVFPVHLNPNVQNVVYQKLSSINNIHLIAPLGYPSFVWLMSKAILIISDSGGVQEEAPSLNIPVLVTRETTERVEGLISGCSILVGTNTNKIIYQAKRILTSDKVSHKMTNPYGDGLAANKVVDFIQNNILIND